MQTSLIMNKNISLIDFYQNQCSNFFKFQIIKNNLQSKLPWMILKNNLNKNNNNKFCDLISSKTLKFY